MRLRNRTPRLFPSTFAEAEAGSWYSDPRRHRFLLSVRPGWWEYNVRADLLMDGQRFAMSRDGSVDGAQRWFVEPPHVCREAYTYAFEVTYRYGFFPAATRTMRLPVASGNFQSQVQLFNQVSWFREGSEATLATSWEYGIDEFYPIRLVVQNQMREAVAVQSKFMTGREYFELQPSNPLPVVLKCGDSVGLSIRYNWMAPGASGNGDRGQLGIEGIDANTHVDRLKAIITFVGVVQGG